MEGLLLTSLKNDKRMMANAFVNLGIVVSLLSDISDKMIKFVP